MEMIWSMTSPGPGGVAQEVIVINIIPAIITSPWLLWWSLLRTHSLGELPRAEWNARASSGQG